MNRIEFQKEVVKIIVLALQVGNPFIRGRILTNKIHELAIKLNLQ